MEINWYPGHMAKAKRLLSDQLSRVDLIIELCDARLPYSSRNPDLDRLTANKKRILLLNKSDLSDPQINREWTEYYKKLGINCRLINARNLKSSVLLSDIESLSYDVVKKALDKGVRKIVRAMVVGVPNVGKSTLINHLHGGNITRTGDMPGVTRSNQWVKISPYLELLDTPGLLWPRLDDQTAARRLCYIGTVSDEVVDLEMLTIHLLEECIAISPQTVCERFHLKDSNLEKIELLDAVCSGRGFLLKGGQYDYDRCFRVVLDEFRGGKLGRISLEKPLIPGKD